MAKKRKGLKSRALFSPQNPSPKLIQYQGETIQSTQRLRLANRSFDVLKRLSNKREAYWVYEPRGGFSGEFFAVFRFQREEIPQDPHAPFFLTTLKKISKDRHLPRIDYYYSIGSEIFVLMEWVRGVTLERVLKRSHQGKEHRLTTWDICRLMKGMASGLERLHKHGVIHGDLHPGNIVLQRDPSHLTLIDFGSAWLVKHTLSLNFGDGGKAHYSAPERIAVLESQRPDFVDSRSDQFSWAVIFYELLTLKRPYQNLGGKVTPGSSACRYESARLFKRGDDTTAAQAWALMDKVLQRCLALNPDERYPTDRALLDDLKTLDFLLSQHGISWVDEQFLRFLGGLRQVWRTVTGRWRAIVRWWREYW